MGQMVEAFIFITTEIGKLNKVYDNIKRLDFVKRINTITGPYDIVALFESEDISNLRKSVVENIRGLEGIKDTTTAIIIEVRD